MPKQVPEFPIMKLFLTNSTFVANPHLMKSHDLFTTNAIQLILKAGILDFQSQFLTANPYLNSVEENWQRFKSAIHKTIY